MLVEVVKEVSTVVVEDRVRVGSRVLVTVAYKVEMEVTERKVVTEGTTKTILVMPP